MTQSYFVPRIPRLLVARPRILSLMPGSDPRPLTVVRAPAGMGKSTLLAQWASSGPGDYDVVWVALSESAAGRFAFWRAVIDRLLDSGLATNPAALADIAPASPGARTLRESLRRGLSSAPHAVTIVLDDYHVARDSQIDDDLVWLLTHVPQLSVVIGTRDATILTSTLTRSVIDVTVIDAETLALTHEEMDELAESIGLSTDDGHSLYAATRGWPMLVRAALLDHDASSPPARSQRHGLEGAVVRIAADVMSEHDESSGFILRTSLAATLTSELAETLSGSNSETVDAHLARLESQGIGTFTVEGGQEVFRYHPLLREEFERQSVAQLGSELPALRQAIAIWSSDHGHPFEAFKQAALAKDWVLLDSIRSRHGAVLTMTHPLGYRELLTTIPDDVLVRYPGLQLSKSLLSARRDRRLPVTVRQVGVALASMAAARKARGAHASPLGRLWDLGVVMILQRLGGRDHAAVAAAAEVARAIENLSPSDSDSAASYLALAHSHIALTYLHAGQYGRALHHAQLDLEAAERYDNQWEAAHALSIGSWALAIQGDIVRAEQWLERARATTRPDGWQDTYIGTGYRLAEAIVALEHFDADTADRHLRALDYHAPTIEHWPFLAHIASQIALTRGTVRDGAHALAATVAARRRRSMFGHLSAIVASARATLDSSLGNSRDARAIDSADMSDPIARVTMARVALVDGQFERALTLAQPTIDAPWPPRETAEGLLIRALAANALGARAASAEALNDAEALMRRNGLRQPLMLVPHSQLSAAIEAAGSGISLVDVPDRFGVSRSVAALTRRELVVLQELAKSGNLDVIAAALVVSRNTVKGQVSSLYRKLGVRNRAEAIVAATELGLIGDE
jgi:LuxR family transcriptional regulator, maltose regulon positive regulatory protein